jgi:hypothetical protein
VIAQPKPYFAVGGVDVAQRTTRWITQLAAQPSQDVPDGVTARRPQLGPLNCTYRRCGEVHG